MHHPVASAARVAADDDGGVPPHLAERAARGAAEAPRRCAAVAIGPVRVATFAFQVPRRVPRRFFRHDEGRRIRREGDVLKGSEAWTREVCTERSSMRSAHFAQKRRWDHADEVGAACSDEATRSHGVRLSTHRGGVHARERAERAARRAPRSGAAEVSRARNRICPLSAIDCEVTDLERWLPRRPRAAGMRQPQVLVCLPRAVEPVNAVKPRVVASRHARHYCQVSGKVRVARRHHALSVDDVRRRQTVRIRQRVCAVKVAERLALHPLVRFCARDVHDRCHAPRSRAHRRNGTHGIADVDRARRRRDVARSVCRDVRHRVSAARLGERREALRLSCARGVLQRARVAAAAPQHIGVLTEVGRFRLRDEAKDRRLVDAVVRDSGAPRGGGGKRVTRRRAHRLDLD